ncbi:hypothetical protein Ocin01_19301 [Orchesella cincta]|uniref:Chitin-binding type-2 domain-containing protein n=1 Tax=Orchesella cincta TaxID=48709 RepID=A0A1D2M392_ORCCI|nr:hypothetical protein Ocin01_19301 [Orchesella cincta]
MEFEAFCPRPLYFSSEFQRCDFPENVAECKRGTRPPVISQEEYMQTEIPTEITSSSTPKPGFLFECGQTIVANSGTIEYKLYENYDAGELCVFVVRSRNYSSFDFVLERHGISDSDPDAITIMGMDNTYGWAFMIRTVLDHQIPLRSLEGNPTDYPPGVEVVFNDEEDSPLQVPYQSFNEPSYNYVAMQLEGTFCGFDTDQTVYERKGYLWCLFRAQPNCNGDIKLGEGGCRD